MTSVPPETWAAPERPDEDAPAPGPTGADAWSPWNAPLALITVLVVATIGGLIVFVVAQAFGAGDDSPPGVILAGSFLQSVAFIGVAVLFARMSGPVSAADFGLRPTKVWRAIGGIVALYFVFFLFALLWTQVVGDPDDEPLLDDLGVDESTLLAVLGVITVCVLAPLVEEFFFRGFFYRSVRNGAGVAGGAVITGLVFGAMHLVSSPIEHIVPLAFLGALFCLLYEYTGSLLPCIALHALNNAIAFADDQGWETGLLPLMIGSVAVCLLIATAAGRVWTAGRTPAAAN